MLNDFSIASFHACSRSFEIFGVGDGAISWVSLGEGCAEYHMGVR